MYDCWVSARHTVISYLKQGYYTITNIRFLLCKSSLMTVPFLDENVAAAKSTFRGLSGQLVSGTIRLIEDSNSTWKIADLQKFERVPRRKL